MPIRDAALRRYTKLVAVSTFLLLLAGGMVTSTGSGLAVPDWPLSFGKWMPEMTGGVFYEHGHRMVATFVGFLIVIEAVWIWRLEPRRWVQTLAWIALGGVIVQGLLGGVTVLLGLPDLVSVSHAALAQIVFGLTVTIALVCSREWKRAGLRERRLDAGAPAMVILAAGTAGLVFLQIVLGAVVRHTGAGLAIPDFPLAYGRLVPPLTSAPVTLHFAHRVGAIAVALATFWCAYRVRRVHRGDRFLAWTASMMVLIVIVQIALGGLTVLSYKAAGITTAHLGTGALLWATSVILTVWASSTLRLAPPAVEGPTRPIVVEGKV